VLRSSEADGGADDAMDAHSTVSLTVTSTAAEMQLHEREVIDGHRAVRRVDGQFGEHLGAPGIVVAERGPCRLQLAVVGKQSQLRVGILVAVLKRYVCTVHLNTRHVVQSVI